MSHMNEMARSLQPEKAPEWEKENSAGLFRFFLVAFGIALAIRIFIAEPFVVNGASMEPTFENGEYLAIDKLTYRMLREPERGEVVVFRFPEDPKKYFIKRIIGLPGEVIDIEEAGIFIVNGSESIELEEPYIAEEDLSAFKKALGTDEYFVMGDNRNVSSDSRIWGGVPSENIVGRVLFRFLPIGKIEFLPGQELPDKE